MATEGKCTNASDKCLADTFCPATSTDIVDCKSCDGSIATDQGCNCVVDTPTKNCMTCTADKCTTCIKGFVVKADDDSCEACSANCLECSAKDVCTICEAAFFKTDTNTCTACSSNCNACTDADTCTECNPGTFLKEKKCEDCTDTNCSICSDETTCTACKDKFVLQDKKCVPMCDDTTTCATPTDFCDMSTKTCKACTAGCTKCKSETICGKCDGAKVPNIFGVCEDVCATAAVDGQYCKDGTAVACVEGLTSECKCTDAKNCGSCSEDKSKCGTCLPGFKFASEACNECDEGYVQFETLCVKPGSQAQSVKLSGGAIAGIVIACIVVVGGVGGGLAYYFIKKNKK